MAELTGKTIGKYLLIERLGRGGMAEVYKAYQPGLDRYVAVKVMHSFLAEEEDFIGRFEREATAVAKLRHPNIVQVIDFDHEDDLYYMVMEFIDGPTLKAELKERSLMGQPFDTKEAAHILIAIANAVDYAHRQGMVHRDLKPANIMFTGEGQPVLTDFGIAKIVGGKRYTMTGAVSGTPAYMSPEQGQGERGDERSDIYSLGIILFEMVTGRVPFDADTPYAIIMKHIKDPLPLPRQVYPQLSEPIERVILKALSKNPDDRYQTAGEMARALQYALGMVPLPRSPDDRIITILSSHFRNVENVGQGGIFSTYKAFHPSLRCYVAVHVLSLPIKSQSFTSDFESEANALVSLSHPNIVRTVEFGYKDDVYYIVTDLIHGSTLKTELQKFSESNKIMPLPQVVGIFEALCTALEYAHSQEMPHLDIKPTNIVLSEDGEVLLADLGMSNIAKASRQTISGPFWATPAYVSPEQCLRKVGDKRSDIYALGVILFEMTTGRVPYESDSPTGVFNMHIDDPLPLARQFNPSVPEKVEAVIFKAMLKDPENRYQTAGEMLEALQLAAADRQTISALADETSRSSSQSLAIGEEDTALDQALASLQRQLTVHKGNLGKLVERKAIYAAGEEPLHLLNQIEAEEAEIARIEAELERLKR